jgi:hypothetical protein
MISFSPQNPAVRAHMPDAAPQACCITMLHHASPRVLSFIPEVSDANSPATNHADMKW